MYSIRNTHQPSTNIPIKSPLQTAQQRMLPRGRCPPEETSKDDPAPPCTTPLQHIPAHGSPILIRYLLRACTCQLQTPSATRLISTLCHLLLPLRYSRLPRIAFQRELSPSGLLQVAVCVPEGSSDFIKFRQPGTLPCAILISINYRDIMQIAVCDETVEGFQNWLSGEGYPCLHTRSLSVKTIPRPGVWLPQTL